MDRRKKGETAEKQAVSFLIENGYEILDRNFSSKFGEIDIVAKKNNTLVFIEVRSRSSNFYGSPEESINLRKVKKIIKTAQFYLLTKKTDYEEIRFDIISILHNNISHIKNAFDMDFE